MKSRKPVLSNESMKNGIITHPIRILAIDGSEILQREGLSFKDEKGKIDTDRLNGFLDHSLDTIRLRDIITHDECKSIIRCQDDYTTALVNVTFKYSLQKVREKKPDDSISENDDLNSEADCKAIKTRSEIRLQLYKDGFFIDGVHYVRYKRSAGSSREGQCLFIAEPLYQKMMDWSSCGLSSETISDQASWQAYVSLTLSSIEKQILIPKRSILLIRDQTSKFRDRVVRVTRSENGLLDARLDETEIENTIWDGEALLDRSVFEENGYADKGMMLLRNRFFKTCAFNTNLQKWFRDNHITRPGQLNGYTTARSIMDIKLVITESSLKFLKFKPDGITLKDWFFRWLEEIYVEKKQSLFGVVKTDKATGPMDNLLVRTNYQLINTLELSEKEVADLLSPSMSFLHKMQEDPMYVRYYSHLWVNEFYDGNTNGVNAENYRQRLTTELTRLTDDFQWTEFYKNYRTDLCKSFKEKLKQGKLLVNGGYLTLFGNGYEFLRAVIDKHYTVDKPLALSDGEIYTKKLPNGAHLLCSRSPHITMGNIFVARNKYVEEYDKYFNLGDAQSIVCVNAICSNLQHRLNGCDYDSDSMLVTDDPQLLGSALKNYDRFPVPFCDIKSGSKVPYSTSPEDMARLDDVIAENRIGEIINLSQFLNSLYWDQRAKEGKNNKSEEIYYDICKLTVLSGMEIDKAKRLYDVQPGKVLSELKWRKSMFVKEHGGKLPSFFAYITTDDLRKRKEKSSDSVHMATAMAFVFDVVANDRKKAANTKDKPYSSLFALNENADDPTGKYTKQCQAALTVADQAYTEIQRLNQKKADSSERTEKAVIQEKANRIFEECMDWFTKRSSDKLFSFLLRKMDQKEELAGRGVLFAAMCYANDGYLLKKIKRSDQDIFDLVRIETDFTNYGDGITDIFYLFGYPHTKGRWKKEKNT